MKNAFHWRENAPDYEPKKVSPQLAYYHRKFTLGIHPRQLRRQGLPVIDQRFNANKEKQ